MNSAKKYAQKYDNNIQVLINSQIEYEALYQQKDINEIKDQLCETYKVMKNSAIKAIEDSETYHGKIIKGNAKKMFFYGESKGGYCGHKLNLAMARSLSATEVNASMGKICAAPTAGSCGILPGCLVTSCENSNNEFEMAVNGLVVASIVGDLIDREASLSGAEGGCQAECGSAAAMAAAILVYYKNGTIEQMFDAAAIVIKNMLGLVCDPVAGLVEVPCSKRNAAGVAQAYLAADMVLAGIDCYIPFDEVIIAMRQVGKSLPHTLKETAQGGVAITDTGRKYNKMIHGK